MDTFQVIKKIDFPKIDKLSTVNFDKNGRYIITNVYIYDIEKNQFIYEFGNKEKTVFDICNNTNAVYYQRGSLLGKYEINKKRQTDLNIKNITLPRNAFLSKDSNLLTILYKDGKITRWDLAGGIILDSFKYERPEIVNCEYADYMQILGLSPIREKKITK